MKRTAYLIVNLILAAVMVLSGAMGVYAASTTGAKEKVELRGDCTLDVTYSSDGAAFSEQNIKLWHVADITEDAQYTLAGSFKDYSVAVTGTSSQTEWNEMTVTLNSYILADGIAPDYTAETDENGKVSFKNLDAGMYIVGSVRTEKDGKNYVFESFMVAVPGVDENGEWLYNVTAKPKISENTPSKGEVTYKAVKTWKDNAKGRPDSVKVEICKDGALQRDVTLNSENNWTYLWKTVDDGSVWTVTEKNVPSGYKVGIQKNGDTFNITNSKRMPGQGESVPKTGDTSNVTLYFLLMALSGVTLVILGIVQRKKRREEETP